MTDEYTKHPEDEFLAHDPYESPRDLASAPALRNSPHSYHSDNPVYDAAKGRRMAVIVVYIASAALALFAVIAALLSGEMAGETGLLDVPGGWNWLILSMLGGQVELVGIILLSVWSYRAYKNLAAFEDFPMRFGSGWVAAYWYIPILGLFRPVQAMNDVFRYSSNTQDPEVLLNYRTPVLLILWWFLWLCIPLIPIAESGGFRSLIPGHSDRSFQ